jgi:hypothetical protein
MAVAAPPAVPQNQSVPVQLELIRNKLEALENMMTERLDTLDQKLEGTDTKLTAVDEALEEIFVSVNSVDLKVEGTDTKLIAVDEALEEIFVSVNSVDLTTTLCFKTGLDRKEALGGEAQLGVGWKEVIDVDATLGISGAFELGLGASNDVCIEIPLYSVFNDQQIALSPAVETQLEGLITGLMMASEDVVPIIGTVYAATMPPLDEVSIFVRENILAVVPPVYGVLDNPYYDPFYNPAALLDLNTYVPLIPPLTQELLAQVPALIETAILDPCQALRDAPVVGPVFQDAALVAQTQWLCNIAPDFLTGTLIVIDGAVSFIEDVVCAIDVLNVVC